MNARIRLAVAAVALIAVRLSATAVAAEAPAGGAWAVLMRNGETRAGQPPFVLLDNFGEVRRYVEPTPGYPLDRRVGERVRIRHDTGETLLASQLEFDTQLQPLAARHRATPGEWRPAEFQPPPAVRPLERRRDRVVRTQFDEETTDAVTPLADDPAEPIVLEDLIAEQVDELPTPSGSTIIEPIDSEPIGVGEHYPADAYAGPEAHAAEAIAQPAPTAHCDCSKCRAQRRGGNASWSCPIVGDAMDFCGGCGLFSRDCDCQTGPSSFVFGDLLVLRATGGDVAYAQRQADVADGTPTGGVGVVGHDYDAGFRIGYGRRLDKCSDLLLTYTYFDTDGAGSISPTDGDAIGSLVHHPGVAVTGSTGVVSANQAVEFQTLDLLYRHALVRGRDSRLNYLLGLQFGHLDQSFAETGTYTGAAGGVIDTSTDITFDGAGLKVGLDGERRLGGRFSLYGRFTAALLAGEFSSDYVMYNATAESASARSDWEEDRVVPQLEYELGVGWTSRGGRVHASAGYQVSHWANAVTAPTFLDAVQTNRYTDVEDTLTFDGAVARIQLLW